MDFDMWTPPPKYQIRWLAQHYGLTVSQVWDCRHKARVRQRQNLSDYVKEPVPPGLSKHVFWTKLNEVIRDLMAEQGLWDKWLERKIRERRIPDGS